MLQAHLSSNYKPPRPQPNHQIAVTGHTTANHLSKWQKLWEWLCFCHVFYDVCISGYFCFISANPFISHFQFGNSNAHISPHPKTTDPNQSLISLKRPCHKKLSFEVTTRCGNDLVWTFFIFLHSVFSLRLKLSPFTPCLPSQILTDPSSGTNKVGCR